jgi:hypothetical protein
VLLTGQRGKLGASHLEITHVILPVWPFYYRRAGGARDLRWDVFLRGPLNVLVQKSIKEEDAFLHGVIWDWVAFTHVLIEAGKWVSQRPACRPTSWRVRNRNFAGAGACSELSTCRSESSNISLVVF